MAAFVLLAALVWAQPLPGGPRGPALGLAVASAWLWWRQRQGFVTFPGAVLAAWCAALALAVAVSLLGVQTGTSGIGYVPGLLAYALAALGAGWALTRLENGAERLRLVLVAAFYFLLADALGQWTFGRDLFGVPYHPEVFEGRLLCPFPDTLKMPVLVAVLFPLAAWPWRERHPWLALLLFLLAAMVVLLSGARSSLVLLVLGAVPVFWRLPRRWWLGATTGVMVAALVAWTLTPALQTRMAAFFEGAQRLKDPATREMALAQITSNRWELWRNAMRMFAAHPVAGVGAKQFAGVYRDYAEPTDRLAQPEANPYHAHHVYLAIAAELGAVGLLVIVGFLAFLRWLWVRASDSARRQAAPWAAALFAYWFPLQSQPVLLNVWWFPVLFVLTLGYLVAVAGGHVPFTASDAAPAPAVAE